jgi:hypothetical protein
MSSEDEDVTKSYFAKKFNFLQLRPDDSGEAHKRGAFHNYSVMVDYEAKRESNTTYDRIEKRLTEKLYDLDSGNRKTLRHASEVGPDGSRSFTVLDDGTKVVRINKQDYNKEYIRSATNELFVTHYSDDKYSNNVKFHDPKNPSLDHYTRDQRFGTRSSLTVNVSGNECSGRLTIKGKRYDFACDRRELRTDANGNLIVTKNFAKRNAPQTNKEDRRGSLSTDKSSLESSSEKLAKKFGKAGLLGDSNAIPSFTKNRSSHGLEDYAAALSSPKVPVRDSDSVVGKKEVSKDATPKVSEEPKLSFPRPTPGFGSALERRKGAPLPLKIITSGVSPSVPKVSSTDEAVTAKDSPKSEVEKSPIRDVVSPLKPDDKSLRSNSSDSASDSKSSPLASGEVSPLTIRSEPSSPVNVVSKSSGSGGALENALAKFNQLGRSGSQSDSSRRSSLMNKEREVSGRE